MSIKVKKVVVAGLGAAGSNIILNLGYAHQDIQFEGIDFDTVEQRNFEAGTQPYTKADLNRPKTQAMGRILATARVKFVGHNVKITRTAQFCELALRNMTPEDGDDVLFIDAFDNAEARNLFLPLKDHHVLHVGFSPTLTGECVWAESYSAVKPAATQSDFDVCQQHIARPFINGLAAIASLLATDFIDNGTKRNVYFDSKLKMFIF
jgi:hypothetical protein